MQSLLAGLSKADVIAEPFPHIVARDVLDQELLGSLQDEFPALESFPDHTDASNKRLNFNNAAAMKSDLVSSTWKTFLARNSDRDHLLHFIRVFGDHLKTAVPGAAEFVEMADRLPVGIKHVDGFDTARILLSSAIDANTPTTTEPSSVRGPHVDSGAKLWVGLFYLRDETTSEGGDLELYQLKPGHQLAGNVVNGSEIRPECLDLVKTVPYEPNTLFIGINSPASIHGVSPRQPTPHPRKFFSFYCDLPGRIF